MTTSKKGNEFATGPQALIKRHPSLSKEQFSTYWYQSHAPKVIPYFLDLGVEYYAQIHDPTLATGVAPISNLDISDWDGAAELKFADVRSESSEGGKKYYERVILVDEKKFLVSEALKHVRRVDAGTVIGQRTAIIEGGKAVCGLDYQKEEELWRTYNNGKEA